MLLGQLHQSTWLANKIIIRCHSVIAVSHIHLWSQRVGLWAWSQCFLRVALIVRPIQETWNSLKRFNGIHVDTSQITGRHTCSSHPRQQENNLYHRLTTHQMIFPAFIILICHTGTFYLSDNNYKSINNAPEIAFLFSVMINGVTLFPRKGLVIITKQ